MKWQQTLEGFFRWPIGRKVFVLASSGTLATALATIVNMLLFVHARTRLVDLPVLSHYMWIWVGVQTLLTAISAPAARSGSSGRGFGYLYVSVQALMMAMLTYGYGTLGSPLVAIFPALTILWTQFLDERIGSFGLLSAAFWILVIGILEARGQLPHAPLILDRSIDARGSGIWFATMYFNMLLLTGFCLSLSVLLQYTRRRQDRKLETARAALERSHRLLRRYVPAQLADEIIRGDYLETAPPGRRRLTIVFSDIEGFTAASEKIPPDALAAVLNEYLAEMVAIADDYGATINQIIGDGIMLFFGAPRATDDRDHALRAVRMALDMQARVSLLRDRWSRHGLTRPFRIRIGINTGHASVGDFGSPGRKLYSGIGLQTNLTERIQAQCQAGKVLISHATWELVGDAFNCVPRGVVPVRDVDYPLQVYEVQSPV